MVDFPTPPPSGTTARTILLLRLLAESPDKVTIKDLGVRTGLPHSTLHRLLQILVDSGMASYDADRKRYGIGMEFLRLAAISSGRTAIADLAEPFMNAVMTTCQETCALISFIRGPNQVSAVAVTESPHPLQYNIELYTARSPLLGATGQSILAFLPRQEQELIFNTQQGESLISGLVGIPDRDAYFARLDMFRARGYSLTRGETIPGAVGIGAPVSDQSGSVVGALCVTIPELRFDEDNEAAVVDALKPQALALSQALGASDLIAH